MGASQTVHVLLHDDLGRLTLRRLRLWHRALARRRAARLDRELADGTRPEASATLAVRAVQLTSTDFRRDLAASLLRILAAAGEPPAATRSRAAAARPPRIPLRLERVSQCAPRLAELVSRLAEPGPAPVQGVAIISRLLADGMGPLYREACRDDLGAIIERATHALTH